ncbi:hypothetical protein RHGRI_015067 [Rhododendron griersonianum]|uniref:Peptidase M1 membrane alanine aminopeptidase domain-containing protein n=1 Tax=Rhododendron griersonianum TaxID=479676 RepID=A0AAV6KBU1_9ERIC|nr:hypothetical protein RHGRI_015067 [Rhododendron griersonianum]
MQQTSQLFLCDRLLNRFCLRQTSQTSVTVVWLDHCQIFNSKLVLASPETATDADYAAILGVIGHEVVLLLHMQYFHNWTGNRMTCRDWFQLSLKEGLTVFRDQMDDDDERITNVRGRL